MKITNVSIGQGYLLVETNKKISPSDLASKITKFKLIQYESKDFPNGGFEPKAKDMSKYYTMKGSKLRSKILQDKFADTYIQIHIGSDDVLLIPGSKEYPSTNHKVYLINFEGRPTFYNPKWNVLSKPIRKDLPLKLKVLYDALFKESKKSKN